MTARYVAERHDGVWHVLDTSTGDVADVCGPGATGANAAAERARALNARRAGEGSPLRQWRKARGLSQAALAAQLGVTWLTVQRWESGSSGVPPYLHLALQALTPGEGAPS